MISFATGEIQRGYGVASGETEDFRFPEGTLAMQIPYFKSAGFDLSGFFRGTLNVLFKDHQFQLGTPSYYFPSVKWSPDFPAENFSFYSCVIQQGKDEQFYESFVYWPHPSTKPDFVQDSRVLEILAPHLPGVQYGQEIIVSADPGIVEFSLL
tara:strand:- start:14 stop:472 length:459 start_codon:yes stop_codon:yes gene_type:complete